MVNSDVKNQKNVSKIGQIKNFKYKINQKYWPNSPFYWTMANWNVSKNIGLSWEGGTKNPQLFKNNICIGTIEETSILLPH